MNHNKTVTRSKGFEVKTTTKAGGCEQAKYIQLTGDAPFCCIGDDDNCQWGPYRMAEFADPSFSGTSSKQQCCT